MLISREYVKQQIGKQEVVCETKPTTPFYADLKRISENMKTTNPKMKKNTKKSTTIEIQRLVKIISTILIQRLGETSGKLQNLSKKNMIKREFDVMIIAMETNCKKEWRTTFCRRERM